MSSPPGFNVSIATDAPVPYSFNTKVMAGAIIVLFLVIFFILMLHVCAKWFLLSSGSYTISRPNATASAHINGGLDKAFIAQLPTFVYKPTSPVDNLQAGKLDESVLHPSLECAVCLSEFQENEKGRMLPSCKHTFHIECIDMWFFSHSTCPLCRTMVGPAMATSPETASTDEQHHEGEEQQASPSTTGGNHVVSNGVEYPCNVLFWGNQMQGVSSQEPSSSSLPLSRSLRMPSARALPQITIDIPSIEGDLLVSASRPLSAKCTTEQEAGSSQLLKSPGLRASIKRMLSRQSSRRKSSGQEVYEGSPK